MACVSCNQQDSTPRRIAGSGNPHPSPSSRRRNAPEAKQMEPVKLVDNGDSGDNGMWIMGSAFQPPKKGGK